MQSGHLFATLKWLYYEAAPARTTKWTAIVCLRQQRQVAMSDALAEIVLSRSSWSAERAKRAA